MATAPQIDIAADKRAPFNDTISEMWVNYTGATPRMEIRAEPGDQGTALVSLAASTAGSQGIAITYDPAYADPDGGAPGASIVQIIIDKATLEGLAYGADPSQPVTLAYDLHLTPSGGTEFVFCAGKFIVNPGVTL